MRYTFCLIKYINFYFIYTAAGVLLVSLVPSTQFRLGFRASHRLHREPQLSSEAQTVLHQVYTALLRLLGPSKHYTDMQQHGTMKLTTYFALLMYCCIGRTEKLMVSRCFRFFFTYDVVKKFSNGITVYFFKNDSN